MKIVHFFDIIKEYHASCYAGFCLKIKWNVSAIAGYKNANGYIVQRVHYIDTVEAAPLLMITMRLGLSTMAFAMEVQLMAMMMPFNWI